MANLALEDSDTAQAIAQADEAIKLSPDALDAMAIHAAVEVLADRSPDAWLDKDPRRSIPLTAKATRIIAHHLVLQPPLRRWHRLLPQGHRARSAALVRALRTGHQPDAPGPGRRAAPAARNVLRQRLSQRGDRQQPAPARQLQEFRHLQGRHHDPQAQQKRSRPAASLFRRGAEARHRHLREEIQDDAAWPGAGRGLSGPRGFRGAHDGHAGPGRAGRHIRRGGRHGQPLGPHAGRFQLGQHAVARDEPRLSSSRPPITACRAGSPKASPSTKRRRHRPNGATASRRTSSSRCATRSCCRSRTSIAASFVPNIPRR